MIILTNKYSLTETLTGYPSNAYNERYFRNQRTGKAVFTSIKNVNHRSQIEAGKEAGTPYSFLQYGDIKSEAFDFSFDRVVLTQGSQVGHFDYSVRYWTTTDFSVKLQAEKDKMLSNESINKAKVFSDLRKSGHGVNAMVSMLEAKETLHLLKNPAESIRKLMDAFSKKRLYADEAYQLGMSQIRKRFKAKKQLIAAEKTLKEQRRTVIAQSWLELQFGLIPLMSDIEGYVKDYVSVVGTNGVKVKKHKRVVKSTMRRPPEIAELYGANDGSFITTASTTIDVGLTSTIYYGFKTVPETQGLTAAENLLRRSGLDFSLNGRQIALENAIPAIWEATRWSFLVDYVTNIGDILASACTFTDSVFYTNYGREYTYNVSCYVDFIYKNTNANVYLYKNVRKGVSGFSYQKILDYERIVAPLTIPSIVFSLPGSAKRYFNIAALLVVGTQLNSKGVRL